MSDLKDMDFEELLSQAEKQGRNSCTNNNFGIYDEYWDTYVKDTFQAGEVKETRDRTGTVNRNLYRIFRI